MKQINRNSFSALLQMLLLAGLLLTLTAPAFSASCRSNPDQKKCCDDTVEIMTGDYCTGLCTSVEAENWCDDLCALNPSEYDWCEIQGVDPVSPTGNLSLSNEPMFLSGYAPPNIMFTLDDSGSMEWEFMPDGTSGFAYNFPMPYNAYGGSSWYSNYIYEFDDNMYRNFFVRSSHNNKVFYDPTVTYTPWVGQDGTAFANADPGAAYLVASDTSQGSLNLVTQQSYDRWYNTGTGYSNTAKNYWPITYYVYDGDGSTATRSNYVRHQVRTDVNGISVTFDSGTTVKLKKFLDNAEDTSATAESLKAEVQNFANWFSYYRSRIALTRAAASQAFAELPESYRIGFAAINYRPSTAVSINNGLFSSSEVIKSGVEPFAGTVRSTFFDYVFNEFSSGGTPLLNAMDEVGNYYARTFSTLGPWANTPSINDTESEPNAELCRRSFNIMMTDGYYNDSTAPTTGGTLAEIATYYGGPLVDLQTGIQPGSILDGFDVLEDGDTTGYGDNPATRPHMTNFTIGLGVTGNADIPDLDEDVTRGFTWTSGHPTFGSEQIDDMLYAAINSGGQFFASANAQELKAAIIASLEAADPGLTSGAAVALNSGALFNGSMLFQAVFDASDWSGKLDAYLIDQETGDLPSSPSATFRIPDERTSPRNIATFGCDADSCEGLPFTTSGSSDMNEYFTALGGSTRLIDAITTTNQANSLAWLRGDVTIDALNGYRDRRLADTYNANYSPMGDIIHSAPVYVGQPNAPYASDWPADSDEYGASEDYVDFRDAQCLATQSGCSNPRAEMVYVGGNDGMLHMFRVGTGTTGCLDGSSPTGDEICINEAIEVGAYVPLGVISEGNLDDLYQEDYAHRYFVDDTVTIGDVFIDPTAHENDNSPAETTKKWQTMLVGSLGGGGKSIYAINITHTTTGSNNGDNIIDDLPGQVMWEYTHPDLGYTYSRPNLVRLQTGEWGVIFGNGYNANDADGDAKLFIIDAATGGKNLEIILDTETGLAEAPTGITYKNGLATVSPIDLDGDKLVDLVYAGDLYGNLWRFDVVDDNNTAKWEVSYFSDPVFTARGPNNEVQPITTRPQVTRHPSAYGGYMIYFGTGKYLETTDRTIAFPEKTTQSYYAIWDRDESSLVAFNRDHLLQQQILFETTTSQDINGDGSNESFEYRITTNRSMAWHDDEGTLPSNDSTCFTSTPGTGIDCKYLGWYMDLVNVDGLSSPIIADANYDTGGERQVTDSVVRTGRVIFTTLMPDGNVCSSEDTGWLMELDAESGARLPFTPFDVNEDGTFSVADYYDPTPDDKDNADSYPVTGRKSTVGILPTPGILSDYSDPSQGKEFKYMSGSSGQIESVTENASATQVGRQSWRQLFR